MGTPVGPVEAPAGTGTPGTGSNIAAVAIRVGTDPCHAGGTEMAPTNRAEPKPADIAEPNPPLPPNACIAGAVEPTKPGVSASTPAAPATADAGAAPCASEIIGGKTALAAGYTPIWATETSDDTGTDETNDPTSATADCAKETNGAKLGPSNDPTDDTKFDSGAVNKPARPVGAAVIVGNAAATDDAPA
jgi:hypothetical protein